MASTSISCYLDINYCHLTKQPGEALIPSTKKQENMYHYGLLVLSYLIYSFLHKIFLL